MVSMKPPLIGTVIMAQHLLIEILNAGSRESERLRNLMETIRTQAQAEDEDLESLKKSVIRNMFADSDNSVLERMLFETLEPFKCGWGKYNIRRYFEPTVMIHQSADIESQLNDNSFSLVNLNHEIPNKQTFNKPNNEVRPVAIEESGNSGNSFVPMVDPTYVNHGCFEIVNKVINSNIFAPIWISGLSGNGKTMGVEQACAKSNRELIQINISNETDESDLIGEYSLEATKFYEVEFTEEQYQEYLQKFGELG